MDNEQDTANEVKMFGLTEEEFNALSPEDQEVAVNKAYYERYGKAVPDLVFKMNVQSFVSILEEYLRDEGMLQGEAQITSAILPIQGIDEDGFFPVAVYVGEDNEAPKTLN